MIRVVTLNLRADANRWPERFPLIVEQLTALNPDVIALQEVRLKISQHELLCTALNKRSNKALYTAHICVDWYEPNILANAILSRLSVHEHERIELPEGYRTAQRIAITLGSQTINIANTHLHHKPYRDETIRLAQWQAIQSWLKKEGLPALVMGDFNARPDSETMQVARDWLQSAYFDTHGCEPDQTFPTPLRADEQMTPRTIDYILYDTAYLTVEAAGLVGTQPAHDDPTLYASDHFGLWADLVIL